MTLTLNDSNPAFSLDSVLAYDDLHCKLSLVAKRLTGLELIKDIVGTVIFWLYKPTLWPWSCRQNPIFSHDILAHGGCTIMPSLVTKDCKTNTQSSGNKYVSRALHPSPLKTPQCFPFSSKIIHHRQRKKRSKVAAASQLMWTGMLG